MRKLIIVCLLLMGLALPNLAQVRSNLKQKCTDTSFYAFVGILASGDIDYEPCPGRSNIFSGIVNFSGATVTGLPFTASPLTTKGDIWGFSTLNARVPVGANGRVLTADSTNALGVAWLTADTGIGTTNFIPKFTNGAAGVLGNSNISQTLLATNIDSFNPINIGDVSSFQNSTHINIDDTSLTIEARSGKSGLSIDNNTTLTSIGDIAGAGNNTKLTVDDTSQLISINSRAGVTRIGDIAGIGNGTKLTVNDTFSIFEFTGQTPIYINNSCAGLGALDGGGQFDVAANACFLAADAAGTPIVFAIGKTTNGVLSFDGVNRIVSSVGAADGGRFFFYWIIASP